MYRDGNIFLSTRQANDYYPIIPFTATFHVLLGMATGMRQSNTLAKKPTPSMSSSSPASHQPTTTLLTLPPELIIKIFKTADSYDTALTLSNSCRRLRTVWKINSDAILPTFIECFPQARDLARVQEQAAQDSAYIHAATSSRPRISSFPDTHITIAHRVWKNVELALRVLLRFEVLVGRAPSMKRATGTTLTPTERADFLRGIYRAMTLAVKIAAYRDGIPHPYLAPLDMLSYMQMKEAMDVLNLHLNNDLMSCEDGIRSLDTATVVASAALDLTLFHIDLMQLSVNRADFGCWTRVPFGHFTLAGGYQAKEGWVRGASLDELSQLSGYNSFFARQRRGFDV